MLLCVVSALFALILACKGKFVLYLIEVNKELIDMHESGTYVVDLATMFKVLKSMACIILKNNSEF